MGLNASRVRIAADSNELAYPGLLTTPLLWAAICIDVQCVSRLVLLNVVRLRLRRPSQSKPNSEPEAKSPCGGATEF